jgi:hypothetical protein
VTSFSRKKASQYFAKIIQPDSKTFQTMMGADAIQSIIEKTRQVSMSIDKERAAISKLVCTRNK